MKELVPENRCFSIEFLLYLEEVEEEDNCIQVVIDEALAEQFLHEDGGEGKQHSDDLLLPAISTPNRAKIRLIAVVKQPAESKDISPTELRGLTKLKRLIRSEVSQGGLAEHIARIFQVN